MIDWLGWRRIHKVKQLLRYRLMGTRYLGGVAVCRPDTVGTEVGVWDSARYSLQVRRYGNYIRKCHQCTEYFMSDLNLQRHSVRILVLTDMQNRSWVRAEFCARAAGFRRACLEYLSWRCASAKTYRLTPSSNAGREWRTSNPAQVRPKHLLVLLQQR